MAAQLAASRGLDAQLQLHTQLFAALRGSHGFAVVAGGGGGCPFLDTRTVTGWEEENSVLGRSLSSTMTLDAYRLRLAPAAVGGRYQMRLRENEREITTLDRVSLVSVDHPVGTRVYPLKDRFVVAQRELPYRVMTHDGRDVTNLVNGTSEAFFVGEPGETLLVELTAPGAVVEPVPADLDPFEMDDGDKGGGGGLRAGELEANSTALDALVLNATGILIQGRDATGAWQTVRRRYSREHFDGFLVDTLDSGPVRLVFVGRHKLRFVGRVVPSGLASPTVHRLTRAEHSRIGDARGVLNTADDQTTTLIAGDTLNLDFAASVVPEGQVRDFFAVTRGVYTSQPMAPERLAVDIPKRLALLQNRPNPFAGRTIIGFDLPRTERVKLEIFDLQGRLVRKPVDQLYQPGRWSVEWDGRDESGSLVPVTMYFYRMSAGSFRTQKKLVILP